MSEFSEPLKKFVKDCNWIFAKTYATTWPHEYIVQEQVDSDSFLALAYHIDTFGYESYFYKTKQVYYGYEGYSYWYMDNIINRCLKADTYQRREKEGRLPEDKK
ncbi:MAG: hypothetical protein V1652_03565 [bacterium]